MSTYVEWLRSLLKEHKKSGKNQKALATFLDLQESAISNIVKGKREIRLDEVSKIAEFFDAIPPALTSIFPIDIIGKIGAGGHIETRWETGQTPLFRIFTDIEFKKAPVVGYQVAGESMSPAFEDGDIVIVNATGDEPATILNKDAVVFIEEEGRFLKKLMAGSRPGHFNLYSYNAPLMLDKPVRWASKIRHVMKEGEYDVVFADDDLGI